jgi:murein lipoprotein
MQTTLTNLTRVAGLALSLGLVGGCATTSQLDEVRGIANSALEEARAARQESSSAQSTASEAASAASEAKAAADAAQACCNEQADKLDRMFQKAMQK